MKLACNGAIKNRVKYLIHFTKFNNKSAIEYTLCTSYAINCNDIMSIRKAIFDLFPPRLLFRIHCRNFESFNCITSQFMTTVISSLPEYIIEEDFSSGERYCFVDHNNIMICGGMD